MNKKQKNILSAIFLGILLLFTCLFILAVALQAYYKLYGVPNQFFAWLKDIDTDDLQTSYVNWEKKYPFEQRDDIYTKRELAKKNDEKWQQDTETESGEADSYDEDIEEEDVPKETSLWHKLKVYVNGYTTKKLLKYEKWVELAYVYETLIGWDLVPYGNLAIPKAENGHLAVRKNQLDMTEAAENTADLYDWLTAQDIPFFYVQAPDKICKYGENMFSDIYLENDYSNKNADALIAGLTAHGIPVLDLREKTGKTGEEYLDLFYKTDHHWTPQTGIWAAGQIAEYLNEQYGFTMDLSLFDLNHYQTETYPDMFLGSTGKKASLVKTEAEDFDLLLPAFETKLHVEIPNYKVNKTGSVGETLMDYSNLRYFNQYKINQYTTYSYGNTPNIKIHNEQNSDGKKVLLVKDSFGNVVIPSLCLGTEYTETIDLRYFKGSLKTYIEGYQPDVVILLMSPTSFIGTNGIDYRGHDSLWDFR